MELVKYDAARYALQQAATIDEVKDIVDKSVAIAAYARQAQDTEMIEWVTEIKVRAERKAGQMLAVLPKAKGGEGYKTTGKACLPVVDTLDDLGITKYNSARWQKLASVPDEQFEQAVQAAKELAGEVTTAAMLRVERANRPPSIITPKIHPLPINPTHNPADYSAKDMEFDQLHDSMAELSKENDKLRICVAANTVPEDEKEEFKATLTEIMAENHQLAVENKALKSSLDSAMNEIVELKRQCATQRKQLEKLKK